MFPSVERAVTSAPVARDGFALLETPIMDARTDPEDLTLTRSDAVALGQAMAEDAAFRDALADLIAFRTDASLPDAPLGAFLDHLGEGFAACGFTLERLEEDGHPFLLASRIEDHDRPTVLGYGHGDTVP
ncbi:MAG: hypothetical protein AAF376_03300, partial [Pseudomonadota bacterium]